MGASPLLCFATVTSLALFSPGAALACSVFGEPKLHGYPSAGADDVPLDVVPVYTLSLGPQDYLIPVPVPAGVMLPARNLPSARLSHEGGSAELSVRFAPSGHFEVVPAQPLAPHTEYTLEVSWTSPSRTDLTGMITEEKHDALSFRTGDAPYDGDLEAPATVASQYLGKVGTSCDPASGATCFSLPDDDALYLAQFEGDTLVTIEHGSFFNNRTGREPTLDCMHIRRRAPNGQLSAETVACRNETTVYDLKLLPAREPNELGITCQHDGLRWGSQRVSDLFALKDAPADEEEEQSPNSDGEPFDDRDEARVSDERGCTVARTERAHGGLITLLATVVAALAGRRRRARAHCR